MDNGSRWKEKNSKNVQVEGHGKSVMHKIKWKKWDNIAGKRNICGENEGEWRKAIHGMKGANIHRKMRKERLTD